MYFQHNEKLESNPLYRNIIKREIRCDHKQLTFLILSGHYVWHDGQKNFLFLGASTVAQWQEHGSQPIRTDDVGPTVLVQRWLKSISQFGVHRTFEIILIWINMARYVIMWPLMNNHNDCKCNDHLQFKSCDCLLLFYYYSTKIL